MIPSLKHQTMDGGYDYETIYQTVCHSATRRLLRLLPDD